ncbi:SEC6 Exocyst complex component SEC6 [Candida maltosa Xu316]|uniref:Exocyst complex component, putative n=1 Tax=Candida maltosa (strain Xu316) TaxID=1245528 RepID=M3J0C4_CANMX|nr:Exocyst complex component, putative [Candida maltosa Xu316]
MSDSTLSKISELIKLEDDLAKIGTIRQQFLKEKSSVDVKLSTTTQVQIDAIMNNLANLNNTSAKLSSIKGSIGEVQKIHDQTISSVRDYDTIKKITMVNQFLSQVANLYEDISGFKKFLDALNQKISIELENLQNDLHYPLPNFMQIHASFTQARNFQDYLEVYSRNLTDDLQSIVYKIVSPMKKTIKLFDDLLNEGIQSLTEVTKVQNFECFFKIIAVIVWEEKQDLKFSSINNLHMNLEDAKTVNYKDFRGRPRNYKKFFFDKLRANLHEIFDACVEYYGNDKVQVYNGLDWLEEELKFVHETLDKAFPSGWKVSSFIHDVYYNRLHQFTMDIINTDPPAEDLLTILSYDSKYGKFVSEFGVQQKSIIGEELKENVLDDYLKNITNRMKEWNDNLIRQETKTFTERVSAPELFPHSQNIEDLDINNNVITMAIDINVYVLPDFKIPLTMLKEQADVAANSNYAKILVEVIENWSACYVNRIASFRELVDEEMDRYMSVFNNDRYLIKESKAKRLFRKKPPAPVDLDNLSPEEQSKLSREGLIEYLAALANSLELSDDMMMEKFAPAYKEKVHTNYHARITKAFDVASESSSALISEVLSAISDIIMNDLTPALCKLFSKKWLEDGSSQTGEPTTANLVVETISEYMGEMRQYCVYDVYELMFRIFLDNFIPTYIRIGYENILHGDGKRIDPHATKKFKSFSEGISRDVETFFNGLDPLFTKKDAEYFFSSLHAIEMLAELGTCDPNSIQEAWQHMVLPKFYDCSVQYIRGVCLCRKDMDKSQVKRLVPVLQEIKTEYHKQVEPPQTTIFTLNDFQFQD